MSLETNIFNFLQTYFFSGYTVFNTLIYGIIVLIAIYFMIKAFKHFKINPIELIFPLLPFIFIGASTRALVDHGIYPHSWFLITPGISFLVGGTFIIAILFGFYIQNKTNFNYMYTTFIIGCLIAIKNILMIQNINLVPIIQVIAIWAVITFILYIIGNYWKVLQSKINLSTLSAHMFDATTTFIAVDFYGYGEEHVLPNSIFNIFHTAATMFPLKIIVILACLMLIDEYIKDKEVSGTLKLAILGLGLLTGLRNLLTLSIGF
jgi:uncharacterized membrane protein